ncbi:MAG: hypothetical protein IJ727_03865, partial [Treponema sp.]|nr:hypothetical protein [Treponema sp.]
MAMVFASEVTGEKEIIFPELAALAVGCFLTPRLVWKTSYLKIISSISLCALLGLGIVCFLPVPLWSQFLLAFALGQLIFFLSKTTFAPMISAISLPVLIQTKSPVYVLSAFLLTFLVILLSLFLEKKGKKAENKY